MIKASDTVTVSLTAREWEAFLAACRVHEKVIRLPDRPDPRRDTEDEAALDRIIQKYHSAVRGY